MRNQAQQTNGRREWQAAEAKVRAQLTRQQASSLNDEAVYNLVDMDPSGLASGRPLLDVLLGQALDSMEEVGIAARS